MKNSSKQTLWLWMSKTFILSKVRERNIHDIRSFGKSVEHKNQFCTGWKTTAIFPSLYSQPLRNKPLSHTTYISELFSLSQVSVYSVKLSILWVLGGVLALPFPLFHFPSPFCGIPSKQVLSMYMKGTSMGIFLDYSVLNAGWGVGYDP